MLPVLTTPDTFPAVVRRLEDLGYLPFMRGLRSTVENGRWVIRGRVSARFPIPSILQYTLDHIPWNWQNPFVRGAVIQFERNNGILKSTGKSQGRPHKSVLQALFSINAKPDPWPWEWVLVDKHAGSRKPETLTIWKQGEGVIWQEPVNTGVLGSTPDGTWPIYQRLPKTTMRGVFPIPVSYATWRSLAGEQVSQWVGSTMTQSARGMVGGHPVRWQPYKDPGILWVNYFDDGRGIHYYPRAGYGFPQSAGCVEEALAPAKSAYLLLHYGVPVSVVNRKNGAEG